jgi:uncharacterized membrane protein
MSQTILDERTEQSLKDTVLLVYILMLISLFTAIPTGLAGVIIAYVKRPEANDSWLASHFDAQIRIFWKSLIGFIVAGLLCFIVIGFPLLFVVWVWTLYNLAIGVRDLRNRKVMSR